jgi:ankyrin repeat protein
MTPLANACDRGYDGIVRILLDAGANAWWKNEWGYSAIFIAIAGGHLSIVEMLLNHDKDLLEIKDRDGETPLQFAISQLQFGIVYRLLDQGANVHGTTRSGKNTLMYACQNGNLDILRLLLAAGVDAEARDVFQKTVLHYAASSRNVEAVRELILQHNANMFAVDNTGNTSFDRACYCEQTPEAAELLLEIYGNKMTQENGRLALHELLKLAEYSFAETEAFHPPLNSLRIRAPLGTLTVKYWRTLLQSFDMELIRNRDGNGKLPIHIACRTNAPVEILSVLVNLDLATLQMADDHGNLPMHECCFGAVDHSSVRYLVEQGGVGTLAARNRLGLLPLHVLCGSTDPSWRTIQFLIESFCE